ncbi:hypothetical protein K1719_033225 [Acacia pycnantha]|nr:hypothetical protein K1719_033225 [Acacia pycnantha]
MDTIQKEKWDDEYSVIRENGQIGLIYPVPDRTTKSWLHRGIFQPYKTLTIWLSCKPEEIGMHTSILHFDVDDTRVKRVVFVLAEDKVSQSLAANMSSYAKFPRREKLAAYESLNFPRSSRTKEKQSWYNLPEYVIPQNVREILENKQLQEILSEGLTRENYAMYFSTLLIMEELQLENEIRCYDMEGVSIRKNGNHLVALEVPGLAERRPSLAHGDKVYAMLASGSASKGTSCEGYIYRVEADEMLLRFPNELHASYQNGNLYDIRFACNRINMRRMYQAVQATESSDHIHMVLFPSESTNRRLITANSFVPFTSGLNKEQKHSIETILSCRGVFLLLLYMGLLALCPPPEVLKCYRIIISIYINSYLLESGVNRGHFSHIFLDEAGQVSEPETVVPISNLVERETVDVLARDPKQLGPVVHSRNAENFGLGNLFCRGYLNINVIATSMKVLW